MKIKIDIISGFLGAGKTTLIKKLISEELFKEKIALIENEFGEIGIDGSILKNTKVDVKEINAGCICCNITGDFIKALQEVIEKYKPERIIIEPSGVAKLSEIIKICSDKELSKLAQINMIITVADILKYELYLANFGEFYRNQLLSANTIVLSRTQKASLERLVEVKDKISCLNDKAFVVSTPWENISARRIIEISENRERNNLEREINLIKRPAAAGFRVERGRSSNEAFESLGFETVRRFSSNLLKNMLDRINKEAVYGEVLRVKGIVQLDKGEWIQFDYVPDEFETRKFTPDYSGRICIIGVNLNKNLLRQLFSR